MPCLSPRLRSELGFGLRVLVALLILVAFIIFLRP
jgi:hypothetical protein